MTWLRRELIEKRQFQVEVVKEMSDKGHNLALVLPTAAGKTLMAFEEADLFLAKGKVVFFAPNTNLVRQNYRQILNFFNLKASEVQMITGIIPPHKRAEVWRQAKFVSATPETMVNDLAHGRVKIGDYSLFIFDEFHQGGDNYAYTDLAIISHKNNITRLGLSATPGVDDEEFDRALANLRMSEFVVRSAESTGLSEHSWPKYEFKRIVTITRELKYYAYIIETKLEDIFKLLRELGYVQGAIRILSIQELNRIIAQARRQDIIDENGEVILNRRVLTQAAEYFKLRHFLSVLMTENYVSAWKFYEKLLKESKAKQKIRASWRIVTDGRFQVIVRDLEKKLVTHEKHPKLLHLIDLLYHLMYQKHQVIIFCNDKNSQQGILQALETYPFFEGKARVIHSESSKRGRAKNEEVIQAFRDKEIPILISTSILEAGIDIPSVDAIINYSLPLEESTMIQRRGRVGRFKDGYIYYLAMDHVFDKSLLYATFAKKRKMLLTIHDRARGVRAPEQLKLFGT